MASSTNSSFSSPFMAEIQRFHPHLTQVMKMAPEQIDFLLGKLA